MNELVMSLLKRGIGLRFGYDKDEDLFFCQATWFVGEHKYGREISQSGHAVLDCKYDWIESCVRKLATEIELPK